MAEALIEGERFRISLGALGWLALLVAGTLMALLLVATYRDNQPQFVEPWFALALSVTVISGTLCLRPVRIHFGSLDRNLLSSIFLVVAFVSLFAVTICSGIYAHYFAQLYILLTFIAIYRFNRIAAMLVCVSASGVYFILSIPAVAFFTFDALILNLAALWISVAMYLLLYSRQQTAQHLLLEQIKSERRLRRQLETTSRIGTRLNAKLNLDELLSEVVSAAAHLVDAPYCSLELCDYTSNMLVRRTTYISEPGQGSQVNITSDEMLGINQGLSGWVVQTGESVSVERAADDPRYQKIAGREDVGEWSLLLVPLTFKQRVMGVLGAATLPRRNFSADDRNLLAGFASQAAMAIENVTLINEIIERKAQLERSQAGLAAVLDINRTMLAQRDYLAALHIIVDNLMPLIPFANCIIYRVEDGILRAVVTEGADLASAENESFPIGDGITGLVAESGVAEMVNHAELDPRSVVIKGTSVDEPSSLLVAPLFVEGHVRGIIRLGRTGDWLFESDELDLLKVFATQASLALENANMIERQKQITNDQSWMITLSQILNSALDIETQLQQVVHASVEVTEADFGALLLSDAQGNLMVAAVNAFQDYLKVGQTYPMDATPVAEAFYTRHVTKLPGSETGDSVVASAPAIAGRFRSQLAVPLVVGDELLGILSVFSAQAAAFDRRFLETLLPTFANQAAIAIRNSQLFAELEARQHELERQAQALQISQRRAQRNAEEQALLFQISKIAVNARSLVDQRGNELNWMTQSLWLVAHALNVEKATLVTLDRNGQREATVLEGFSPSGEGIIRRHLNNCDLHQFVEQERKPGEVEDCTGRGGMLGMLHVHEGVYNALAVPLMVSDQLIGVITVYNKKPDVPQSSPFTQYSDRPGDGNLATPGNTGRYYPNGNGANGLNGNGNNGSNGLSGNGSNGNGSNGNGSNVNQLALTSALAAPLRSIGDGGAAKSLPAHPGFDKDNQTLLWNMANAIASGIENVRNYKSLSDTYFDSIRMLVDIMEAKDPYTKGHSEKVMVCALAIGEELIIRGNAEFKREHMGRLLWAALLHDIGKLGIRDELLHLASRPGVEGFWVLASHTRIGAKILSNIEKLKQLAPLVQAHHERWDGQGYPDGLLRTEIPFISRIVTVADCFDAMTSDRDYQKKRTIEWAIEELQRNAGSQFDPEIVEVFLYILREQGDPRERAVPEIGPAIAPDWVRI